MKAPAALSVLLVLCACGADTESADAPRGETTAVPRANSSEWPADGAPVQLQRERSVDLTGDGAAEIVSIAASGTQYDSLAVAVTIASATGDTLWYDTWSSMHYFKYDMLEGKADSTVRRIVRGHVDALLEEDRFSVRGLPQRLAQGAGTEDMMRDAVQYHLAELDWRSRADLTPADELPPDAHSRIDAGLIAPERVAVVLDELRDRPAFWYYAGGEETYAIAWSEREHAFVRLYSCC